MRANMAGLLSMLGPPTRQMITTAQGDVIAVQAAVRGGVLLPRIPPHHLFLGHSRFPPLANVPTSGLMQTLNLLRSTPGYIGSWPRAGFLDLLPFNLGGSVPDANGFSRAAVRTLAAARRRLLGPLVRSAAIGQCHAAASRRRFGNRGPNSAARRGFVAVENPAVDYEPLLSARTDGIGRQRTIPGALESAAHVPLDRPRQRRKTCWTLELICPLGGEYQLVGGPERRDEKLAIDRLGQAQRGGGSRRFRSSAAQMVPRPRRPSDADPAISSSRRIELDMQRQPTAPKIEIPLFNFNSLFGGGQKALKPKDPPKDKSCRRLCPRKEPPKPDRKSPYCRKRHLSRSPRHLIPQILAMLWQANCIDHLRPFGTHGHIPAISTRLWGFFRAEPCRNRGTTRDNWSS